jgi:hypothetical protein
MVLLEEGSGGISRRQRWDAAGLGDGMCRRQGRRMSLVLLCQVL